MSLTRRQLLPVLASAAVARPAPAATRPPNILMILADDQGWGDLSISGNVNLSTPRIDSLARDGARFDRFFVCPVCAPTRAELLTGRYHPRGGVRGVSTGTERLNLDETTMAQIFRAAGYTTGIFGKWHNGTQFPYHPNARGFDEFYGFTSGHWGNYFSPELDHNGEIVRGNGYIADDLTDHALAFMERSASRSPQQPFLCYVPFNTPHSPMQVPDRFYNKFANAEIKMRARDASKEDVAVTRAALAMSENLDWNVGRLLDGLTRMKLDDNTIVLYFSDNGPANVRWNGGMKGIKGSTDEGGIRSPLMMRWKGRIPAGKTIAQISGAIDLLPTLADLAGIEPRYPKPLDGRSLRPLLTRDNADWSDRTIFTHQNGRVSVRTQQHRLDPDGHLYDMVADPGQDRDIAAAQPEVRARLAAAVKAWSAEMLPLVGPDHRPFLVGNAPLTQLPARDGVEHGGVRRSSKYPNSSYFLHWTSPDDSITWDVQVDKPGEYDATLYYAAAEPGAVIELSFDGRRVSAPVRNAHNPPPIGAEHDRTPRIESYLKDFAPMPLGRIRLNPGRGPLTLHASGIPPSGAAEVWSLLLRTVGSGVD